MSAEDEHALTVNTLAALAAFGGPATVGVEGEDSREIDVRAARIDGGGDHALALVEIPADIERGRSKRIDVFLAPHSDLEEIDGEQRKLRTPMKLYSLSQLSPPDYIAVIAHMDADAWFKPAMAALERALRPVIDQLQRRPLN